MTHKKVDFFKRNRIHVLMQKAIQHSVVMITAGRGYGKTQSLKGFLDQTSYRHIWLTMTQFDQDTNHFWDTFLIAIKSFSEVFYSNIQEYGFPKTVNQFNSFIRQFTSVLYNGERLVFVIDNYDKVNNYIIDEFFKQIIDLELENLCLILVTSDKTGLGMSALIKNELYTINNKDLAFRFDEIDHFFKSYGRHLSSKQLHEIEKLTGGWPIALSVLKNTKDLFSSSLAEYLSVLDEFFEESFSTYPFEIQKLFIQLSFISTFTIDIIRMLGEFEPILLFNILKKNMFIHYDLESKQYSFWRLYRDFLHKKDTYFNDEARLILLKHAGEMHLSTGRINEAITCFLQYGDYNKVLETIADYVKQHITIKLDMASFFLNTLNIISNHQIEDIFLFKFIKAKILINNMSLIPAQQLLLELSNELHPGKMLSDVYWLLGKIAWMDFNDSFLDYFEKSHKAYPPPKNREELYIGNIVMFRISNFEPGAVEHAKKLMKESIPFWKARFGNSSMVDLFFAETYYYTYQLEAARSYATKAAQAAFQFQHHDILCSANRVIALICLNEGDYEGFTKYFSFNIRYIETLNLNYLNDFQECARGVLHFVNKNLDKVDVEGADDLIIDKNMAPLFAGGHRPILFDHLLKLGRYEYLITFLEETEKEFIDLKRQINLIEAYTTQAVAYFNLGDTENAFKSFHKAYDMTYHNNIITPFINHAGAILPLLEALPIEGEFDTYWIKKLYYHASVFQKRIANIYQNSFTQQSNSSAVLTKREKEVLKDLSTGLTREEISATRYITVSTVKTIITSIYNKLGAVNRADAIRIALKQNLL